MPSLVQLKFLFCIFFGGLQCVGNSFAYVAHFVFFERCLDSNPESCRSKQARYQLNKTSSGMVFVAYGSQIKCLLLHVAGCQSGISLIRKPALPDSVLWCATP